MAGVLSAGKKSPGRSGPGRCATSGQRAARRLRRCGLNAGRLTAMKCEQRQAIERHQQEMENKVLQFGSLSQEGRIFSKFSAQGADQLEAHKKDCPICKGA